jgi:hypothetical protein
MIAMGAFTSGVLTSATASAAGSKNALINADSVSGGVSSHEYKSLVALGFTPTLVSNATWQSMTASQFGKYQLLVIGDSGCPAGPTYSPGDENSAVWAPVVMGKAGGRSAPGNRIVVGTDPVLHGPSEPGAYKLISDGLKFAGAQAGRTGVYYDISCSYPTADPAKSTIVPTLTRLSTGVGTWTIDKSNTVCGSTVSLISTVASFADLTTADIEGWDCSVHQAFPTFKSDWSPLALATDPGLLAHPVKGIDKDTKKSVSGEPYVMVAGAGISTSAPDISLTPLHATGPTGSKHTVTAHVTSSGKASVGQLVTFTVTGQNGGIVGTCGPATCKTDASGNVTFTYPDTFGIGTDSIIASFVRSGTGEQTSAEMTWVAGTPTTDPCATTTSTSTSTTTSTLAPTTSTSTSTSTSTTTSSLPPPAERIIKAAVTTTTSSTTTTTVAPTTTLAPSTTAAPTTVDPACTPTTVPAAPAATAVAAQPTFTG